MLTIIKKKLKNLNIDNVNKYYKLKKYKGGMELTYATSNPKDDKKLVIPTKEQARELLEDYESQALPSSFFKVTFQRSDGNTAIFRKYQDKGKSIHNRVIFKSKTGKIFKTLFMDGDQIKEIDRHGNIEEFTLTLKSQLGSKDVNDNYDFQNFVSRVRTYLPTNFTFLTVQQQIQKSISEKLSQREVMKIMMRRPTGWGKNLFFSFNCLFRVAETVRETQVIETSDPGPYFQANSSYATVNLDDTKKNHFLDVKCLRLLPLRLMPLQLMPLRLL